MDVMNPWGDPAKLPHDSVQLNLAICAVTTWLISAVFVGLRIYTRRFLLRVFGWEDVCIILSLLFAGGSCAGALDQIIHGSGKHVWDIRFEDFLPLVRAQWYTILLYFLSLGFTKLSILLLYHNIFTYQSIHIAVYIVSAIVIISNLWIVASTLTACIPLKAYWDFTAAQGARCWGDDVWWTNLSLHMGTDWLIFLMPLPVIWRLTVPGRQKCILVGVFALGFFVCFVSVFRLVKLIQSQKKASMDFSFDNAVLAYWTSVEVSAAIVCACLMTLKPLVSRFFPFLLAPVSKHSVHSQGSAGAASSRQMRNCSKSNSPTGSPMYHDGLHRDFIRHYYDHRRQRQETALDTWFDDDLRPSREDARPRRSRSPSPDELFIEGRRVSQHRDATGGGHAPRALISSPFGHSPQPFLQPPPPAAQANRHYSGTYLASPSDEGRAFSGPPASPAASIGTSTFGTGEDKKIEFYDSSSDKTSGDFAAPAPTLERWG